MEMYFREYAGNSPVTQPHPEDIPDHNNPHNAHISLLREVFFIPSLRGEWSEINSNLAFRCNTASG